MMEKLFMRSKRVLEVKDTAVKAEAKEVEHSGGTTTVQKGGPARV